MSKFTQSLRKLSVHHTLKVAAAALVLVALVVGSVPVQAAGQPQIKIKLKPLTISVKSIKCIEETDEVGADEPYVLVVGADLTTLPANVEATLYGPWGDVDQGETHGTKVYPLSLSPAMVEAMEDYYVLRKPFWGLDNKTAQLIAQPTDVVFIVAVMENDDGKPKAARQLAKTAAIGSLVASVGMNRATRVQKLIADINSAMAIPTGAPNFDDRVGSSKELQLTATDILKPMLGPHEKTLSFSGDGGQYQVVFEFKAG